MYLYLPCKIPAHGDLLFATFYDDRALPDLLYTLDHFACRYTEADRLHTNIITRDRDDLDLLIAFCFIECHAKHPFLSYNDYYSTIESMPSVVFRMGNYTQNDTFSPKTMTICQKSGIIIKWRCCIAMKVK